MFEHVFDYNILGRRPASQNEAVDPGRDPETAAPQGWLLLLGVALGALYTE